MKWNWKQFHMFVCTKQSNNYDADHLRVESADHQPLFGMRARAPTPSQGGIDYEQSLFRIVHRAWHERKPPENNSRIFFLAVFFRVTHDGLSERGTTRSLKEEGRPYSIDGRKSNLVFILTGPNFAPY